MDQSQISKEEVLTTVYGSSTMPSDEPRRSLTTFAYSPASKMRLRLCSFLSTFIKIFFPSLTFVKFFFFSVIPPMADNIIPLFYIGNIPNESGLAVASQFTFISIILEVIQEGVGNSLFHFVGTHYEKERQLSLVAFKFSLVILLIGGISMTILMLLFTPQFVNFIDTPDSIVESTKVFLYTSSFSFIPMLLNTAFTNYLLITTSAWLVVSQLVSVLISFCNNFILFGQLGWGIEHLGYYKVFQSTLTMFVNFVFILIVEKMSPIKFLFRISFFQDLKKNFKAFFFVSWGNFMDSAVRNFFYFVVTLKFINKLGEDEAGAWNLLNGIVWGIILIPAFVVSNYAKVKIGHNSSRPKIKLVAKECFICLMGWILVVSVICAIFWPDFASFFGKSNEKVQELSYTMLKNMGWIFIVFACNNAIDSFFFGTGKTEFVFYQSLITNMVVYFIPWLLYLTGILEPTYWWTMGLYISGMLVDFCFTTFFCLYAWKSIQE